MATERLPMRTIREILRLKWLLQRSHRETARSLGISAGAVASVVTRAAGLGLTWATVEPLSEDDLDRRLHGPRLPAQASRAEPDPVWIHLELRRKEVTLELLHLEYLADHPDGFRYSAFCRRYRDWTGRQRLSMRQVYTAGEKTFVDYAGLQPHLVHPDTGELLPVELFVAVLGASNFTYAEATLTQQSADFIASHSRAVEYFGGVSAVIIPDQLRTGVGRPCRYEPGLQRTYAEWACTSTAGASWSAVSPRSRSTCRKPTAVGAGAGAQRARTGCLHAVLRLRAMAEAYRAQLQDPAMMALSFDERLALLVEAEHLARQHRLLDRRLKEANLRIPQACLEDVRTDGGRGVERRLLRALATGQWIAGHQHILITGPTGVGKTYLACAFAQQACRQGYRVLYRRLPRLFDELTLARADGTYGTLMSRFARADVLVLDDWGLTVLKDGQRQDVLEILEDRDAARSTIITSQLPRAEWHVALGDPTIADAILDRLVHNAHEFALTGPSQRGERHTPTKK